MQKSPLLCPGQHVPGESLINDVCQDYGRLIQRHKNFQMKRRRIRFLAMPRFITPKFKPTFICNSSRMTEIVREMPAQTRTEQLSYPYYRKLAWIQRDYRTLFDKARHEILNRTIRKSILSLYSRLANRQAPTEIQVTTGWTKKEWMVHRKYLKKLARPKKLFKAHREPHVWKELKQMKRYKKLSRPKKRVELVMPKWELTAAARHYNPSTRMMYLSKPKERDETLLFQPLPIKVSPNAMRYKASTRIKELATPPEVRLGESDLKENPFGISPNALKAKASGRIVELAEPKEYSAGHTRENPFQISPAALKAKASPRTIELAKPKGSA